MRVMQTYSQTNVELRTQKKQKQEHKSSFRLLITARLSRQMRKISRVDQNTGQQELSI